MPNTSSYVMAHITELVNLACIALTLTGKHVTGQTFRTLVHSSYT